MPLPKHGPLMLRHPYGGWRLVAELFQLPATEDRPAGIAWLESGWADSDNLPRFLPGEFVEGRTGWYMDHPEGAVVLAHLTDEWPERYHHAWTEWKDVLAEGRGSRERAAEIISDSFGMQITP